MFPPLNTNYEYWVLQLYLCLPALGCRFGRHFSIDYETASILGIMHCGVNSADAVCAIAKYLDAKLYLI